MELVHSLLFLNSSTGIQPVSHGLRGSTGWEWEDRIVLFGKEFLVLQTSAWLIVGTGEVFNELLF